MPWKSLLIELGDNLSKPYSDTEVHLVLAVPPQHKTQWLHASPQGHPHASVELCWG